MRLFSRHTRAFWGAIAIFCRLLQHAVARKLFDITDGRQTKMLVRFITKDQQAKLRGNAIKGGYTVWKMKTGAPTPIHVPTLDKAVKEALR